MQRFWPFWGQIGVDLRAKRASFAAFKKRLSFVFKYFLASFPLFSIFCNYLFFPIARAARLCFVFRRPRQLLTTMCPQYDHNYRLSWGSGFVKRKMRKRALSQAGIALACRSALRVDVVSAPTRRVAVPGGSPFVRRLRPIPPQSPA